MGRDIGVMFNVAQRHWLDIMVMARMTSTTKATMTFRGNGERDEDGKGGRDGDKEDSDDDAPALWFVSRPLRHEH